MKFKVEDIVYYIGRYGDKLEPNKKYKVLSNRTENSINIVNLETGISMYGPYIEDSFISELEYRRLKLIKLKNEIQKRRHSLLC